MPGQNQPNQMDAERSDGNSVNTNQNASNPDIADQSPCTIKSIICVDHRNDSPGRWRRESQVPISHIAECKERLTQSDVAAADTPSIRLLKDFCGCTSAHGFHKIFKTSSILHRLVWMLIIISATVGFTVHLCFLISRFYQSPVNTETQVYSTQFVFPDVTICSTSQLSQIRFDRDPKVDGTEYTINQLIEQIRKYWDPENPSQNNSAINGDVRNSLKGYLHLVNITKQRQDMIVHCRYTGATCSYRDFIEYVDPEYVSCYTFSPRDRHLIVGGEKEGGLILILYGGDGKNFITEEESLSFSIGYRVVIHEQGTRPNMMDGFYIQKGTNTYAQLAYTKETVLSKKTRVCIEEDSLPSIEFLDCYGNRREYRYSITDCSMYRYQEYLNKTCKCLSEMLPLPAIYQHHTDDFREKFCHRIHQGGDATAPDRSSNISRRACHDKAVRTIHSLTAADRANCSISCTNLQYEMRITQNDWPSDYGESTLALLKSVEETAILAKDDALDDCVLEDMRKLLVNEPSSGIHSFLKLNIYSHSTMGNMVIESWAYPARNLFSDIGGILGLWLGVSLISTFEFVELIIRLASVWHVGQKKQQQQQEERQRVSDLEEAHALRPEADPKTLTTFTTTSL